jgi:predicted nucleic acid-binding protein
MKTVSKTKIFIDTNILFYANNPTDPFGSQAILRINELANNDNELIISTQVIREYTAVSLRTAQHNKLPIPETVQRVLNNVAAFRRDFTVINETNDSLDKWLLLLPQITTSRDVFDFNIAATLQSTGINHILTHNVSDFKKFSNWLTVLPLIVTT